MNEHSAYDEGLVAAALGLPAMLNPYEVGTVHRRAWRDGFTSYGVAEEDAPASEIRQLESAGRV
jgi:hypothetical protein